MAPNRPKLIDSQPIPDNFQWRGKNAHLTYPGHIDKQYCWQAVRNATTVPVRASSICHETATNDVEGYTYDHTHVALIFESAINIKGCHKFDVYLPSDDPLADPSQPVLYQIHPNFTPHVSTAAMRLIFNEYHLGRKFNVKTGQKTYTELVWLEQHVPHDWLFDREVINEIVNAPSLSEACVLGELRPRSVNDAKLLRDEAAGTEKRFKHKFGPETFKPLVSGELSWALWLHGGTGLGKTKVACAQFQNPLVIKPFKSVGQIEALGRRFVPGFHDGVIFDEVDLKFLSREDVIALLDPDEDADIDVRYKSVHLEPVKKILISNGSPIHPSPPQPHTSCN